MTSLRLSQGIVSFDIGLGLIDERQGLRRVYLEKLRASEVETEHKRKKLLDAYAEELSLKRLEWANIQVSVVAGAGFEPAAFRL